MTLMLSLPNAVCQRFDIITEESLAGIMSQMSIPFFSMMKIISSLSICMKVMCRLLSSIWYFMPGLIKLEDSSVMVVIFLICRPYLWEQR